MWCKHTLIQRIQAVSNILVKHDPAGLIKIGAPLDEYEGEAVQIGVKLKCNMDVAAIADLCCWVFTDMMGEIKIDWTSVAEEILALYSESTPPNSEVCQ